MTTNAKILFLAGLFVFCGGVSFIVARIVTRRSLRACELELRVKAKSLPPSDNDGTTPAEETASSSRRSSLEEYTREITDAMYGRQPQEAPAAEGPHLTDREIWLMTRAYLAGQERRDPESFGEWLGGEAEIPDPFNGGSRAGGMEGLLANWAAHHFGYPGQTPGAR